MIHLPNVVPLLLERFPEFQPAVAAHRKQWPMSDQPQTDLAAFGLYLTGQLQHSETATFPKVFATIEDFLTQGDEAVVDVIGSLFLLQLQTIAGLRNIQPDAFAPWLGPATNSRWQGIADLRRQAEVAAAEYAARRARQATHSPPNEPMTE